MEPLTHEEVQEVLIFLYSGKKYSKEEIKKFESNLKQMKKRLNFFKTNNLISEVDFKDVSSTLEGKMFEKFKNQKEYIFCR